MMPTEDELKSKLTPEEYDVLRNKGTEIPYTGDFLGDIPQGTFVCKVCGNPLFYSNSKYNSMMGWPSFDQAVEGSVIEAADGGIGLQKIAVSCAHCRSHLGHVIEGGLSETGKIYNINSVSLILDETKAPPPRTERVRDDSPDERETLV